MHTVGLLVYPNFQSLGLAVASVFEYANIMRGEKVYSFSLVSEEGGPVMTSQGFSVNTDPLRDSTYDTLIVAGDNECRLPAASLLEFVRDAPNHSRRVASICTGAFVLAAAGLLEGKRATTHWFHAADFKKQYPNARLDEDRIFGQVPGPFLGGVDHRPAPADGVLTVEESQGPGNVAGGQIVLHG